MLAKANAVSEVQTACQPDGRFVVDPSQRQEDQDPEGVKEDEETRTSKFDDVLDGNIEIGTTYGTGENQVK